MNNYTDYRIISERELLVEYLTGEVNMDDFKRLKTADALDKDFDPNYNIIVDFRGFNLQFTPDELKDFAQYIKTHKKLKGKRNTAVISLTSNHVVSSIQNKGNRYKPESSKRP